VSYAWDFGDGTTQQGAAVTHAYGAPTPAAQPLTVTLTIGGGLPAAQPGMPPPPPGPTDTLTATAAVEIDPAPLSAPAFTSAPSATFVLGQTNVFQIAAAGSPAPTITADALPAGVFLSNNGDGTANLMAYSTATPVSSAFALTAANAAGSATQAFTLSVVPFLDNPGDQSNVEGDTVALLATTHGASPLLRFSAADLPDGLSIDPTTGLIAGTIAAGAAAHGPLVTTVTATDTGITASQVFVWDVAPRVSVLPVGDQQNVEGDDVWLPVEALSPLGLPLAYSAAGLPDGLTIAPDTGEITGPIAAGASANGPFTATVTATDGVTAASQTFRWDVVAPVALSLLPDQQNAEGDAVSIQVPAAGPDGLPLTYTADGLPPGLGIEQTTGLISGTLAPGAAREEPYAVTVTVTDGQTSDAQSFAWSVASRLTLTPPDDQQGREGDAASVQVTGISPDGLPLAFSAAELPPGLAIDQTSGLITGTPAAGSAGRYTPTVTVSDGTFSARADFVWDVAPRVALTPLPDQQNVEGDAVSLQVAAASPDGLPLTYSADDLPAGLSIDSASGLISGTVAAGAAGGYRPTIQVSDGTFSDSQTLSWDVTQPPPALTVAGQPFAADVGDDFSGTVAVVSAALPRQAADLTASIDWGDGTPATTGTVAQQADGSFAVSGEHAYAAEGTFTVTVAVTSAQGDDVEATFTQQVWRGWDDPASPFYARSLAEAKYRAWVPGPTDDSLPVGAAVAGAFGVDPNTTWGDFFPTTERDALAAQRQATAAGLDPVLLFRLGDEYQQAAAQPGFTPTQAVGEDVAARWQAVPGFEWVEPETGWQELDPVANTLRRAELRAVPIPTLRLTYNGDVVQLDPNASPLLTVRFLNEGAIGSHVAPGAPASQIDFLVEQVEGQLLPRLRYATPEELADYVAGLSAPDRLALSYALGREMARLQPIVAPGSPWAAASQALAQMTGSLEKLALCQQLYAELNHGGSPGDYGLAAGIPDAYGPAQARLDAGDTTPGAVTAAVAAAARGTYAQRLAFLADTDYATFVAREPKDVENLPSPEEYYTARDELIQAVRAALANGSDPGLAVAALFSATQRANTPLSQALLPSAGRTALADDEAAASAPPESSGSLFDLTADLARANLRALKDLEVKANPSAGAARFVFDRYLRGAGTSPQTRMPTNSYYALDRYSQAYRGFAFLSGWAGAGDAQKITFADALAAADRLALLDSLNRAAAASLLAGDSATAQATADMANFIEGRFNDLLKLLSWSAAPQYKAAFDAKVKSASQGKQLPPEYRWDYDVLPLPLHDLASSQALDAYRRWLAEHPTAIKYDPALGFEFLDRLALNLNSSPDQS
jgi:hypothetical protein